MNSLKNIEIMKSIYGANVLLHCSNIFKQATPVGIRTRTAAKLSFKIFGESSSDPEIPPVIILHTLFGSKKRWKALGKTILNMTKRSVLTVDLRNHGHSPHVNSHKYEDMSSDLLELYKRMGIERACLVGHGMGGRTAMYLALNAPKTTAGLLIVDVSPVSTPATYKEQFPEIMKAIRKVDFNNANNVHRAVKMAKRQLKKVIRDDVLMSAVLSNVNVQKDGTLGWDFNVDTLIRHFKHVASFPKSVRNNKYYGPTFFVGGQFSEFLPPDDLNKIRAMFPKAVVSYVPKTGHYVHIDDPKTFMEITIAFLRTIRY